MQTFSVQEITRYIHELFDADDILVDVRVRGEISNLTKASSGHWYFTLKDAKSQLRCVMFRSAAQFVQLDVKVGDEIVVPGRVSVYDARGEYQLYASTIEAVSGVGDLHQQFEALKAKLDAEGLFDPANKLSLPPFPRRIGIVTSPAAAAYQDILNVLSRRFPLAEVILSPTVVQGADAPREIVAALARLYARNNIDVIIVARGGGSLEDLWCFNDETVARTIAASHIAYHQRDRPRDRLHDRRFRRRPAGADALRRGRIGDAESRRSAFGSGSHTSGDEHTIERGLAGHKTGVARDIARAAF